MCSTFKVLVAGAVPQRVDRGAEHLDRPINFTKADLLEYAPVTTKRVGEGHMSVAELCDAAITVSDNTAANLLLASIGGPGAVTTFARSIGDRLTRLDRNEPTLNEARPGDPRDTTTPSAMLGDLERLLLGDALSSASRATLTGWLVANTTGGAKLRADVPPECRAGDKTGSGANGSNNDVAVIWPPNRKALRVASYLTGASRESAARDAVHAAVGWIVYRAAITGTI